MHWKPLLVTAADYSIVWQIKSDVLYLLIKYCPWEFRLLSDDIQCHFASIITPSQGLLLQRGMYVPKKFQSHHDKKFRAPLKTFVGRILLKVQIQFNPTQKVDAWHLVPLHDAVFFVGQIVCRSKYM